jgi:hypothetical protein
VWPQPSPWGRLQRRRHLRAGIPAESGRRSTRRHARPSYWPRRPQYSSWFRRCRPHGDSKHGRLGRLADWNGIGDRKIAAEIQFFERQIVRVDMFTRLNRSRGASDDIAVLDYRLSTGDPADSDLVAGGNRASGKDALVPDLHLLAGGKRHTQWRRCRRDAQGSPWSRRWERPESSATKSSFEPIGA